MTPPVESWRDGHVGVLRGPEVRCVLLAGAQEVFASGAEVSGDEDRGLLGPGLEEERRLRAEAMATEDRVEAVQDLAEKREPRFRGR